MTKLDWSPDMDNIITSQTLAFFHQALDNFKQDINSVYKSEIKDFITNRQALTDEELEEEYIQRGEKLKLPSWITRFSKLNRTKRGATTTYAHTNFSPMTNTVMAARQHRLLQQDINDLIFSALKHLNDNINIKQRIDKFTKIKEKGTKTEFFRFEDIFREIPNATTTRDNNNLHSRQKRVAPLLVVAGVTGVVGTFMGMYNKWEIENLKGKLAETNKNHNLLVQVTERQEEQINRITENMNAICVIIQRMIKYNPTLIAEQITAQINLFETRLTMATNAVH